MRCTCGTIPVDGALFCHKCGRPLREDLVALEAGRQEQTVEARPPQLPAMTAEQQPDFAAGTPPTVFRAEDIGFHNPIAVRIALLVALVGFLGIQFLGLVPGGVLLYFPLLLFVGVAGVYFYRRRTGVALQPMSGARLGWLTGLFVFLILLVLTTLAVAAVLASNVSFSEVMKKAMESNPAAATPEARAQFEKLGSDEIASIVLLLIATFFVLLTVVPTIGGLLGAKLMGPRSGSNPN